MSHALPREWFNTSIRNDSLKREKARLRGWNIMAYLGAAALPLAALLFYILQGVQVIKIGYEIDQIHREYQVLLADHDRLEVELASLESLQSVARLAMGDLAMVYPEPGQVIHVREVSPVAVTAEDSPPVSVDGADSRGVLAFFRKIQGTRLP